MHQKVTLMTLVAVLMMGCTANHPGHGSPPVTHVVICWLKQPGDLPARVELIQKSRAFEGKIPGLLRVYAGEALPSTRPVVDSSYDVAVVMIFKDEASLRGYEAHPLHQEAVRETLKPLLAKFAAYDFLDRTNEKGRRRGRPSSGIETAR